MKRAAIWIAVFAVIIGTPHLSYILFYNFLDHTNYENRDMKAKPVFSVKDIESYPEQFEAYYEDVLPYRNQLIQLNSRVDYYIFKQSSSTDVLLGRDGWLFFCEPGMGNPLEQSLGYWHFSEEQLQTIAQNMMETQQALADQGVEFVLFIAPNKESVYMEYIPDYYRCVDSYTSTMQLVDYLREHTDIMVVWPYEAMLRSKETSPDVILYRLLDTHWNNVGAYIGAACLAEGLGMTLPPLNLLGLQEQHVSRGDLADMINLSFKNKDLDYELNGYSKLYTENKVWEYYDKIVYQTEGAPGGSLVMCGDSFRVALAPYAATLFEESYFIDHNHFAADMISEYDADVFVLETVERHTIYLQAFNLKNQ